MQLRRESVAAILASAALAMSTLSIATLPAAEIFAGVSLKIGDEQAPAGATVQMKIMVTEAKPISTARGRVVFSGFDSVDGIAINSPGRDAYGVAVVRAGELSASVVSPRATFGMNPDYPVITVRGRVAANAASGTVFPLDIDPAATAFQDGTGAVYPTLVQNGSLGVANVLSVSDVRPGGADLPAGSIVSIFGSGFAPDVRVRFGTVSLSAVRVISSSRIDVVLAGPASMHGMRIRVENKRGPRITYFSYQPTSRSGVSNHPVLQAAMPLFPPVSARNATITAAAGVTGLALQNLQSSTATVTADLFAADGVRRLATARVSVSSNRFLLQELSEVFQMSYVAGSIVKISSATPIQAMGVSVDASGRATPILPR
jgi:hypothetical protein